jgi:thiol-disulfide isomerase/thioredoxin
VLGIAALALVVLLVHPQPPLLAVGNAAPPIVLMTSSGVGDDVIRSAGQRPVAVEFFETSCPTCQQKAPSLCALQATLPQAVIVGVNAAREPATALNAYAQRYQGANCNITLLADPNGTVNQSYEISVVPTVYVIDKNGKIAYAGIGAQGIDGLKAVLQRLTGG